MLKTEEERISCFKEQLLKSTLMTKVVDTDRCVIFCVKAEKTMMNSFYVGFLPAGIIAIYGDFSPTVNGCMSNRGLSLDWFLNATDPDYLGEKFLQQGWHWENAVDEAQHRLEHPVEYELTESEIAFWKQVATLDACSSIQDVLDYADEHGVNLDESPGYGFNPNSLAQLTAIQQHFRQVYNTNFPLGHEGSVEVSS